MLSTRRLETMEKTGLPLLNQNLTLGRRTKLRNLSNPLHLGKEWRRKRRHLLFCKSIIFLLYFIVLKGGIWLVGQSRNIIHLPTNSSQLSRKIRAIDKLLGSLRNLEPILQRVARPLLICTPKLHPNFFLLTIQTWISSWTSPMTTFLCYKMWLVTVFLREYSQFSIGVIKPLLALLLDWHLTKVKKVIW